LIFSMGSNQQPKDSTVRVAVTQHESAWLDLEAGVEKTCSLIEEAAQAGAKLVTFPECWIPGYPAWIWARNVDFDTGVKYVQNCLPVDSPEMKRIQESAAENNIHVALGFSERSGESVYIAQAFIDNTGKMKMTRRKMKPTHMERTIFGDASGECLADAVDAEGVGKVGSLSCWEHIQPLLKYYTFSQQEKIHVAAWPPLDNFTEGSPGLFSMSTEGESPTCCSGVRLNVYCCGIAAEVPYTDIHVHRLQDKLASVCHGSTVLRVALHRSHLRGGHQDVRHGRRTCHGLTEPRK
jgi:Carbon-nitrogen hydrolase